MALIRPTAVLLATAMSAPALYRGFVTEELDFVSALTRFLIAVPAAALMLAVLRFVTTGYGASPEPAPARRRSDQPDEPVPDPPL
jgi:hypothetical protein